MLLHNASSTVLYGSTVSRSVRRKKILGLTNRGGGWASSVEKLWAVEEKGLSLQVASFAIFFFAAASLFNIHE